NITTSIRAADYSSASHPANESQTGTTVFAVPARCTRLRPTRAHQAAPVLLLFSRPVISPTLSTGTHSRPIAAFFSSWEILSSLTRTMPTVSTKRRGQYPDQQ